jgi:hypothetical protein
MTRQILTALFGLPLVAMAADFSGSWTRDSTKSDPAPDALWLTRANQTGRGGGRGGRGGPGAGMAPEPVMVVQQDSHGVQITDLQGAVQKFTFDGKPTSSTTETGMQTATSTASVEGDTLVVNTTRPYGGMPGNVTLKIKEVWSLSPDGRVLTVTTTRDAPAVEKTFKQVYNRK